MSKRRVQRELNETRLRPSDEEDTYLLDLDECGWRFKFVVNRDYPFHSPQIWCQPCKYENPEAWARYVPPHSTVSMYMESIAMSIATDKEITDSLMEQLAD